jgi:hypothetical protein
MEKELREASRAMNICRTAERQTGGGMQNGERQGRQAASAAAVEKKKSFIAYL